MRELPILTLELERQAARPRSHIVRCIAIVVLALLFLGEMAKGVDLGYVPRGLGAAFFEMLVLLQLVVIYALVPARIAGAVAGEDERRTLELLLMAPFRTASLLGQKLGARLVPTAGLLSVALPLYGLSYYLGGLDGFSIFLSIYVLALALCQVGVIALLCSCFFRTASRALIGCYALLGLNYLLAKSLAQQLGDSQWRQLCAPLLWIDTMASGSSNFWITSGMLWVASGAGFGLAVVLLQRRARVRSKSPLQSVMAMLDRGLAFINHKIGGASLAQSHHVPPAETPILWRESHQRALHSVRHWTRALLVVEGLALGAGIVAFLRPDLTQTADMLSVCIFSAWVALALIVSASASGLVATERAHGSLDLLLVTPISGDEIVIQKLAAVRRLMVLLAIPLLSQMGREPEAIVSIHKSGTQSCRHCESPSCCASDFANR